MLKPIEGSWFEFQHPNEPEAKYYNAEMARFTADQWRHKVREASQIGMEYLVLMAVSVYFKAFYDTALAPKFGIECDDPLEAVLDEADKCGVKFFISNDWFDDAHDFGRDILAAPAVTARMQAMEELAARYGHHPSFYGWYWPNEAYLKHHFKPDFIQYANMNSRKAHELLPRTKTLIAPYGTGVVHCDDVYRRQLEELDVDIIAYQDEIGCLRHGVDDLPRLWENLRRVHDLVPNVALWADIEVFEFEGAVGTSALLPAPFHRVRRQIEAAAPYVDRILIYQFQGMMNPAGTPCRAGHPSTVQLYEDYVQWLGEHFPQRLSAPAMETTEA